MKKWSLKKKSVNDEISANELRPKKSISIKNIFKMNFLPITFLAYSVVVILIVMLFMSGSSENTSPNNNDNTFNIWTASELAEDMQLGGDISTIQFKYKTLIEGDSIIIQDTIRSITYDAYLDVTTIKFDTAIGYVEDPVFEGDLTILYSSGDLVKISVTITRISFTLEPPDVLNKISYDLEIFQGQWESEEYFVIKGANADGLKPLPPSIITKL